MSPVASASVNAHEIGRVAQTGVALPLLVVCRAACDEALLRPLRDDHRFEVFVTEQLTQTWTSFAQRVAAGVVLVATDDPLGALVYARTAGIEGKILLAVDGRRRSGRRELENAGEATCISLPFSAATLDKIAVTLNGTHSAASVEPTLRLLFDPIARVVRYRDNTLRLSQREFALLHYLAQHCGRPVPADQILSYVWEDASAVKSRQIVDVYVCQLRRKLARIGLGNTIRTLRGYGYTLETVAPIATT
jgi:DNA-binding response OmpR family regulator